MTDLPSWAWSIAAPDDWGRFAYGCVMFFLGSLWGRWDQRRGTRTRRQALLDDYRRRWPQDG